MPQGRIVEWMLESHARAAGDVSEKFKERLRHFTLSESHIQERYFDCGEVDQNWEGHRIYHISQSSPDGAGIEERNLYFAERAKRVFAKFYENEVPSHLIHVTCTGYVSPSPPQAYFSYKERSPDLTHAYHMGCYASLPSVRLARALALSERAQVDVVHTEMCSLHLNAAIHTPEQMVVQSLFADGHIKYCVSGERKGPSLKIKGIHEKLLPESLNDMTWVPGAHGMMMTLSREVPVKIRSGVSQFITELCSRSGEDVPSILSNALFAIHPGGPKIIEAVQKKLELRNEQVSASKKVLLLRGNMSSATLPHVWKEILGSKPGPGTKIVSLAFGPGLTIFGALFEVSA